MPENKEVSIGQNNSETTEDNNLKFEEQKKLIDLEEGREAMVPREVKSWMQKLEEDPGLNANQNTQQNDDSSLGPLASSVTKITLPTDRSTFTQGFSKPINQAWRWFSEFILRIVKQKQGKVKFKEK